MSVLDDLARAYPFCPRCRGPMDASFVGGRSRPVCSGCGFVQFLNPAPGAGVIVRRGEQVCLVERKFAPKQGQWTLPTGFVEWDEEVEETAVREAKEETGLDVRLKGLFAVHSGILPPDQPVIVVFYEAEEIGGELRAGDDAARAGFFALDDLPGPIAFAAHRKVLRALGADLASEGDRR
jgi:ADP-ribose pyrophosphatase YjhB (NUDIX family)